MSLTEIFNYLHLTLTLSFQVDSEKIKDLEQKVKDAAAKANDVSTSCDEYFH